MPPIIIGGGNAYFREIVTRRLRSCCDLLLRDQHLIADITLSEAGETVLDTVSQSLVGAINECLAAIILEDLWDRAGTLVYPHNAGDSVRSDALLYTIGGGLSAAFVANSLSMGHDPAGHTSWIQSAGAAGTNLAINPQGGELLLGNGGAFIRVYGVNVIYASQRIQDDVALKFGNGSDVWIDWSTVQTNSTLIFALSNTSKSVIFCEESDRETNFGAPNYNDPTGRWQSSDATSVDQYVAKQHNQTDAKEIIGTGSEVTEHLSPVELADDASFDLPDASSGFGFFQIGDGEEYAQISWDSAANVTLLLNSANVVNTDTDTNFCLFDNGTAVRVRNRLGAAKKVIFRYNYWTP